ncbi:hypothetical protein [Massilia endophytica]|uniref:hypothetical protein n=1 Tax=Massilia endophytica TaxID=2899220 RepID=UPI001E56705B|nr:hypothetical protein [Massilia endophytica]UGQ48682.1 hypothetical protein LSQ66_09540 [Massilia endophytica]
MRIPALILLAAASAAAYAAGPAPRLWEAVRPSDPGLHIYVLAATAHGLPLEYDSYFDNVVLPAFSQAEVLHYEGAGGLPPDAYPPCAPGLRAQDEAVRGPGQGAVAFALRERRPQMRVADLDPVPLPGMSYCSMGRGRIALAPLAGSEPRSSQAELAALAEGEAPPGLDPAAICPRNARWLRTLSGLRDGRTHFVVADVQHVRDVEAPAGRCRGILNGLLEAGFVVWPVAEFRPIAEYRPLPKP